MRKGTATVGSIDLDRQQKAKRYATWKHLLFALQLVLAGLYLGSFLATGLAVRLSSIFHGVTHYPVLQVLGYFVVLWVGFTLASLPLTVVAGWVLPRRYGLSTQTFGQWLADWLKGEGIGMVLGLIMVETVYTLLRATPGIWWLICAILYVIFVIGLAQLGPVVLLPLFYKLVPLEDSELADRLRSLARAAGAEVAGVFRLNLSAKTTAANAALTGLGRTRRVVLGDTLLDQYTPREIEVIFAHELGHHVHRDIPRMILVHSLATALALFVAHLVLSRSGALLGGQDPSDVATMPLLALVLGLVGLLTAPATNWYSRHRERAADCYALQVSRDPGAFMSAMIHLANQNLAVYRPARWVEILFDDHPSIAERMELAEAFARTGRCE